MVGKTKWKPLDWPLPKTKVNQSHMHPWRNFKDLHHQGLKGCTGVISTMAFQLTCLACAGSRSWRTSVDYHKFNKVVDSNCSCFSPCGFIARANQHIP